MSSDSSHATGSPCKSKVVGGIGKGRQAVRSLLWGKLHPGLLTHSYNSHWKGESGILSYNEYSGRTDVFPVFFWDGHYPLQSKMCEERSVNAACCPSLFLASWLIPVNSLNFFQTMALWSHISILQTRNLQPRQPIEAGKHPTVVEMRKKTPLLPPSLGHGGLLHFSSVFVWMYGKGQTLNKWTPCRDCVNSWVLLWLDVVLQLAYTQACGNSVLNSEMFCYIILIWIAWNDQELADATL